MSLSSVIDIGVGLVLVYYIVSTVVSAITNVITNFFNLGSQKLLSGLREMLADPATYAKFSANPLIQGLGKKQMSLFGNITVKPTNWIPKQTFAIALFDTLVPDEQKGGDEQQQLAALRQAVTNLPPGKTRDSLVALVTNGENSLEKTRERVADWFDSTMDSVSDLYEQHVRMIVWIVAAVVTLALGIDSINIAQTLWQQPTIRAAAATQAAQMAQSGQLNLQSSAQTQDALNNLTALRIPLLWDPQNMPNTPDKWLWKIVGLLVTWVAAAQGAPFWYDILKKVNPS